MLPSFLQTLDIKMIIILGLVLGAIAFFVWKKRQVVAKPEIQQQQHNDQQQSLLLSEEVPREVQSTDDA